MPKRTDLLDRLRNYVFGEEEVSKEFKGFTKENAIKLLKKMKAYYRINDYETGQVHAEIFDTLYLNNEELHYDDVAAKYFIHTVTLDRYRQRYNKLAKKLIGTIKMNKPT